MNTNNRAVAPLVVAALALSIAWGTTATADSDGDSARQTAPALSKSETKAVKKLATKIARNQARKQARKQIIKMAPTLRVGSAESATNAQNAQNATNAQNASHALSADMATNAQNAANAAKVGGLDVKKFTTVIPAGAPAVEIVVFHGFALRATCEGGAPGLRATSSVGGRLRSTTIDNDETVTTNGSNNLAPGGVTVASGGVGLGTSTVQYTSTTGEVVNIWVGYRDDAPGCGFFGNHLMG